MNQLEQFRAEKDEFFRTDPQSPLTAKQQESFEGLAYFPENSDLDLEVTVERFSKPEEIAIQTSTGDTQVYTRYGRFQFKVDGEPAELTIYAGEDDFFLPFVDSLAGEETYPAGRYLEPVAISPNQFVIDFNYAYNPYCAYNERWSCPLTPFENRLKVPIRAGEKLYPGHVET